MATSSILTPARRLAGAPLPVHAAGLALLLLVLVPVVGTTANLSADEGAVAAQADHLADGDGWTFDHPFPEVDPDGTAFPLEKSTQGDGGFAPFSKHPLYPLLLAGQPFGAAGMVLLSVAGTVAAAVLAALLSRRVAPGLDRLTLWVVGLVSPLLFDGYVVIAHTLGAAAAVGAVLLVVEALERRRAWLAVAAALPVLLAVAMRTEAVLFGLALGVACGVLGLRRRDRLALLAAAAAGGAAAAGFALDRLAGAAVVSGSEVSTSVAGGADAGFVGGRLQALLVTWFLPGYQLGLAQLLTFLAFCAVLMAAVVARSRPEDGRAVVAWSTGAAVLLVVRLVFEPAIIPGLLVAFPLLLAGMVVLRRSEVTTVASRLCLATSALFAVAVLLTQYAKGGGGEWGGRYFALALPVVVPPLLDALRTAGGRLDATARRRVLAASAVVCLALSLTAVLALRHLHQGVTELTDTVLEVAAQTEAGDGGLPVVVSKEESLPRFAWADLDQGRFLIADGDALDTLAGRLHETGIEQVVLVQRNDGDSGGHLTRVGAYTEASATEVGGDWTVSTLQRSPAGG